MPIAHIGQKRIWYQFSGQGEPLLQLHGTALGHANFSRVTPVLSQHFRVLDFDMVGFGESSPVPPEYTLQDWTDDVRDLMDTLEIPQARVHGTSGGGFVALQFAARYPERVKRLVLVGTIARYDTAARLNRKLSKQVARHLGMEAVAEMTASQVLTRQFLDSPEAEPVLVRMRAAFGATSPDTYITMIEATEAADLGPELARIAAPTLVIVGELSQLTPVETGPSGIGARGIAEGVRNGRLLVIPQCSHLVLMERFQETCDAIIGFLKE